MNKELEAFTRCRDMLNNSLELYNKSKHPGLAIYTLMDELMTISDVMDSSIKYFEQKGGK